MKAANLVVDRRARRATGVLSSMVLAITVALTGCSSGGDDRSIVLYNGQHTELTRALVAAFEKQSGIDVRMRTNDSITLANQILQEGDNSPADVYVAENSPELMTLAQKGALAPLPSSITDQVPSRLNGPDGSWAGMALRVSALAYDPDAVSPGQLPASVMDLTKPQWKGKVGIAPTDSDFVPLIAAIIVEHGEQAAKDWLAGMKGHARIYQDDEAVVDAVNRGDIDTGIINSYYWYRLQLEKGKDAMHSAVYYFPNRDVGSIENTSGAAVLKASGKRKDAQAFVRFLVSPTAQRIIAKGDDYEYPARPGVAANPDLPPLSSVNPAMVSLDVLGNGQTASKLILASGLV